MSARTRRRWQPEEKRAVIKDIQEKGSVVETCRMYSAIEYRTPREAYQKWKQEQEGISTRGVLS